MVITLLIKFDNKQTRKYNIMALLKRGRFAPLKNQDLFKTAQEEQGGYVIVWNSNIDISEYELWARDSTTSLSVLLSFNHSSG